MSRQTVAVQILKSVRGHGRGYVFTASDFLDIARRAAVDQALSRLTKEGRIRRLRRGLYDLPRRSARLGVLSPDLEQVRRAIERASGAPVRQSAARVANQLGLTSQVPARMVFETTAPKRRFKMGLQDITLRHRSPRLLNVNDARLSDLLRALRHLGPGGLTPVMVARFAAALQPADKRTLRKYRRRAPLWLHPVLDAITSEQP